MRSCIVWLQHRAVGRMIVAHLIVTSIAHGDDEWVVELKVLASTGHKFRGAALEHAGVSVGHHCVYSVCEVERCGWRRVVTGSGMSLEECCFEDSGAESSLCEKISLK